MRGWTPLFDHAFSSTRDPTDCQLAPVISLYFQNAPFSCIVSCENPPISLDEWESQARLVDLGSGTLALARHSRPYGVPVSFGYDGDRLFLYFFQFGNSSKKIDFSEQTEQACLTAFHTDSASDWRSVIVDGTLTEVTDEKTEYVDDVMTENAWFPSMFPPTAPLTAVRRIELLIDNATGRKGEEYW